MYRRVLHCKLIKFADKLELLSSNNCLIRTLGINITEAILPYDFITSQVTCSRPTKQENKIIGDLFFFKVYHLAFLVLFAIFMMTELGYDVQCGEQGNTTTGEMVNTTTMRNSSLLVCLESPYGCLITFTKCHWAEMATLLCMGNNFVDELRQVSSVYM